MWLGYICLCTLLGAALLAAAAPGAPEGRHHPHPNLHRNNSHRLKTSRITDLLAGRPGSGESLLRNGSVKHHRNSTLSSMTRGSPTRALNASVIAVKHPLERIASARSRDAIQRYGKACKVLFLGDSIIFYLKRNLSQWQANWAKPYASINAGNPGDRTEHILHRMEKRVYENLNLTAAPIQLVVLMVGTNNIGAGDSSDAVFSGIKLVVGHITKSFPSAKIALYSVLPRQHLKFNATVAEVNSRLAVAYGKSPTVNYLNVAPAFLGTNATLRTTLFETDGLHPNAAGGKVLLSALQPLVAPIAPYAEDMGALPARAMPPAASSTNGKPKAKPKLNKPKPKAGAAGAAGAPTVALAAATPIPVPTIGQRIAAFFGLNIF